MSKKSNKQWDKERVKRRENREKALRTGYTKSGKRVKSSLHWEKHFRGKKRR